MPPLLRAALLGGVLAALLAPAARADEVSGTDFADILTGAGGASLVTGLDGADTIRGDPVAEVMPASAVTAVSVAPGVAVTGPGGRHGVVSPDGKYVAFVSDGALIAGVTGTQLYVKELATGKILLQSRVAFLGAAMGVEDMPAAWSPDGKSLLYASRSGDLDQGADFSGTAQVLLQTAAPFWQEPLVPLQVTVISHDGNAAGNGDSGDPSFGPNGEILFTSLASNLGPVDTNGKADVYLRRTDGTIVRLSVDQDGAEFTEHSGSARFSPMGGKVVFVRSPSAAVPADMRLAGRVIVKSVLGELDADGDDKGEILFVTPMMNGQSRDPVFSPDGREVAFATTESAFDGSPTDTNGREDVYVRTLAAGAQSGQPAGKVRIASTNKADGTAMTGLPAGAYANRPAFSADGTILAFSTLDVALAPNSGAGANRLYVGGVVSGALALAVPASTGTIDRVSFAKFAPVAAVSGTAADILTAGTDGNGKADVFALALVPGQSGDDTLVPGRGNDTVYGGSGKDTAVYPGPARRYTLSSIDGGWKVRDDLISDLGGDFGTDVVYDVEEITFDDTTISLLETPLAMPINEGPSYVFGGTHIVRLKQNGSFTLPLAVDPEKDLITYVFSLPISGTATVDKAANTITYVDKIGPEPTDMVTVTAIDAYGISPPPLVLDIRMTADALPTPDPETVVGDDGADQLDGGEGSDLLLGYGGDDNLFGGNGPGQNRLYGGTGNDTLAAGANGDKLYGEDGDDMLTGGDGNDLLDGGSGNDILAGGSGADELLGGAGNDDLDGGGGNDVLDGGDGADTMAGGSGDAKMYGRSGNDIMAGGAGADELFGGAGNDDLDGGAGNDLLDGGDGADTLAGGSGTDQIFGGNGNDVLHSNGGGGSLDGGSGNDVLHDEEGGATMTGGVGDDTFHAGGGSVVVEGPNGGKDTVLVSGAGKFAVPENVESVVIGALVPAGGYKDYANDWPSNVTAFGKSVQTIVLAGRIQGITLSGGAKTIVATDGYGDIESAGAGGHVFRANPKWRDFFVDAYDDSEVGTVYGFRNRAKMHMEGIETVYGTDGEDVLIGDGFMDFHALKGDDHVIFPDDGFNKRLDGGDGRDTIYFWGVYGRNIRFDLRKGSFDKKFIVNFENVVGSEGNDTLTGTKHQNVIEGHWGQDNLTGRGGPDIFVFEARDSRPGKPDTITDFDWKEGDRIDLRGVDAKKSKKGVQPLVWRGAKSFSGAGQVRVSKGRLEVNLSGGKAPELVVLLPGAGLLPRKAVLVSGDKIKWARTESAGSREGSPAPRSYPRGLARDAGTLAIVERMRALLHETGGRHP